MIYLLAQALKGKAILKSFALVRNEFVNAREGIDFAVKLVEDNPNLEQFDWVNNRIETVNNDLETMEDARYLVDAITSHTHINHIRFENSFGEDIIGYEILRSLVTNGKRFLSIDLERNNIRTGGGTVIPDFLAANPPLKKLFLANNHLNDADAILIARALKKNTNLQRLRLGRNDLTEEGENALSNAICDSTSLNSVSDCNHSCRIITGIGLGDIPNNNNNMGSKVNRARKIYHLLSRRNREGSNVHHLNQEFDDEDDASLMLVPKLLESVHHYSRNRYGDPDSWVDPLSIMYEILRSWEMPALYENCGMPKA